MSCDGLLLIYKKKGETSHDAVYKLRKKFNLKKTGHTGTLDPQAEGLLVVMVNEAVKISRFIPDDKTYEAEFVFGRATDTYDAQGKVIKELPVPEKIEEIVRQLLPKYTGVISQIPPAYSAVSRNGVRAYKLARQGKEVNLQPRNVTVYSIQIMSFEKNRAKFLINCSSGTYIRGIARDIGEEAGTCAYMSALKRTKVGPYKVEDSRTVDDIISPEKNLIEIDKALEHLPEYEVPESERKLFDNGNPFKNKSGISEGFIRLKIHGKLCAIGRALKETIQTERKLLI